MSPDWSAKEDPVPYAVLTDPQSLNLYSYVGTIRSHQWTKMGTMAAAICRYQLKKGGCRRFPTLFILLCHTRKNTR